MTAEAEELWREVQGIYSAFLAGDRDRIDRSLSPAATIWDSEHEPLLRSKAELDAVRDARPDGGAAPTALEAIDPVIDVYGDVALVRHVLVVGFPPESGRAAERIRNTSVWRKVDGRWLCVHNHEDVVR